MDQCQKGEHIILTDKLSQTFCGFVKSINRNLGRIVLRDIILLPSQKQLIGNRNFDRSEIVEIKKCVAEVSGSEEVVQKAEEEQPKGPEHQEQLKGPEKQEQPKETEQQEQQKQSEQPKQTEQLEQPKQPEQPEQPVVPVVQVSESEYKERNTNQNGYWYIKHFDSSYHHAISLLKKCSKIGVYGEDVSKGRFERLSVIAISTPSNIFLFDVQVLGDDILREGLKEVLESPVIAKVVYDCRLLSDCLKHKHLISLENVRDIEAEDIMVVYQERRMIRRHSRSLGYLAQVYLGLELKSCPEAKDWTERPLPKNLCEVLVSHVSLLITLQEEVERKYLQKLISASNVYNNHLRNLDFFDVLHDEPKKTLKSKISKLLVPQTQIRADYKSKQVS